MPKIIATPYNLLSMLFCKFKEHTLKLFSALFNVFVIFRILLSKTAK